MPGKYHCNDGNAKIGAVATYEPFGNLLLTGAISSNAFPIHWAGERWVIPALISIALDTTVHRYNDLSVRIQSELLEV